MRLRPRQKTFVERSIAALREHHNTLAVAPTGAGKTVMFSEVAGQLIKKGKGRALILAHRDELTAQNQRTFLTVNPKLKTSVFDRHTKDVSGQAIFSMVQTLCREKHLKQLPPIDLLVIDEAHHVVAKSYQRIIEQVRHTNPDAFIYGVTATPNRGDKKGLREVFTNLADQIDIRELIATGHLVKPRTFVIDVGVQKELKKVRKVASDYDMAAVEAIMDTSPVNDAVIKHWIAKAGKRKTVIFCSTLAHAKSVQSSFIQQDIKATLVCGTMSTCERKQALADFEQGNTNVIVNVAVLTEGWDFQPTSCVVLLRPSSYKSTLIQMIGRGLRVVDPNKYPDVLKDDCIVLDFGTSSLMHGCLEMKTNLDIKPKPSEDNSPPNKQCPDCDAFLPAALRLCPFCDHIFEIADKDDEKEHLSDFVMSEIDLLKRSSFRWCDLYDDDASLMACGFNACAGMFYLNGHWYAIGIKESDRHIQLLAQGDRINCLAVADDFLNQNESDESAHKSKRWLNEAATVKQLALLPVHYRMDLNINKYHATCLLRFKFNKKSIQSVLFHKDQLSHSEQQDVFL